MGITLESVKSKMLGNTFGELTVLEYAGRNTIGENLWKCRCSCGRETTKRTSTIEKTDAACKSCKRIKSPLNNNARTSLLNQVFGRLKVIEFAGVGRHQNLLWKCQCDCGNIAYVISPSLRTGATKSCGCYSRDVARTRSTVHALHKHPLYAVWWAMKQRCNNPRNDRYKDYGGRGIQVCDEWNENFMSFFMWSNLAGYRPGLTLERRDNNGDYGIVNCRWATRPEQMQNTRRTKITVDKVRAIRQDARVHSVIAEEYGVDESTISRIQMRKTWKNVD